MRTHLRRLVVRRTPAHGSGFRTRPHQSGGGTGSPRAMANCCAVRYRRRRRYVRYVSEPAMRMSVTRTPRSWRQREKVDDTHDIVVHAWPRSAAPVPVARPGEQRGEGSRRGRTCKEVAAHAARFCVRREEEGCREDDGMGRMARAWAWAELSDVDAEWFECCVLCVCVSTRTVQDQCR